MNILIIEDENPAADRLITLLKGLLSDLEILAVLDTIEASVEWFLTHSEPDLIFLDIQLADGVSFGIFEQIQIKTPIIFTTAYDQFAIQAFKVNSIDYLLKPIEVSELQRALDKYQSLHRSQPLDVQALLTHFQKPKFQQRFMIKIGEQYKYVSVNEIAYFMAEGGIVLLVTQTNRQMAVDYKLEELDKLVDPKDFFRLNRSYISHIQSIQSIRTHVNSRLKVELTPPVPSPVIISRDRVSLFKQWMNS